MKSGTISEHDELLHGWTLRAERHKAILNIAAKHFPKWLLPIVRRRLLNFADEMQKCAAQIPPISDEEYDGRLSPWPHL